MLKSIINSYKNLSDKALSILKKGLSFCLALCGLSLAILITYLIAYQIPTLYNVGISLFKSSCIFATEFIICAIVIDHFRKNRFE